MRCRRGPPSHQPQLRAKQLRELHRPLRLHEHTEPETGWSLLIRSIYDKLPPRIGQEVPRPLRSSVMPRRRVDRALSRVPSRNSPPLPGENGHNGAVLKELQIDVLPPLLERHSEANSTCWPVVRDAYPNAPRSLLVKELANELEKRGLSYWLNEWDLVSVIHFSRQSNVGP
jgi:hypothetical protein